MIKLALLREILMKDSKIKIYLILLEEVWVAWVVWEDFSQFFKIYLASKGKILKVKILDKRLLSKFNYSLINLLAVQKRYAIYDY